MKELRELYEISKQENWIPDSHDNHIYAPCGRYMLRVAHVTRIVDAKLIAAMHNALPELLNAWEMVQAVIEFTDVHRGDVVEVTQDVGYSWCISDLNKILKPYSERDAQKNEGVE